MTCKLKLNRVINKPDLALNRKVNHSLTYYCLAFHGVKKTCQRHLSAKIICNMIQKTSSSVYRFSCLKVYSRKN